MSDDVRSVTEIAPWVLPITDGVVLCKDSGLLACFEFNGVDADSVGEAEAFQTAMAVDRVHDLLRDRPVTLWWSVRRERATYYPGMPMPTVVGQWIDDENRAIFQHNAAYENRHFLSVLWMPERSATGFFEQFAALTADGMGMFAAALAVLRRATTNREALAWSAAGFDRTLEEYEQVLTQIESTLSGMSCRRLRGNEHIGLLWSAINPGRTLAPKQWDGDSFLDALLPERAIGVTRDTLSFDPDSQHATHANIISMKSWPQSIAFGAFDTLLSMSSEMVVSHCYRVQSQSEALKRIDQVKRLNDLLKYPLKAWIFAAASGGEPGTKNMDPARAEAADEMVEAKGELNSGRVSFGWHAFSVMLLNADYTALEADTATALRLFHSSPFTGAMRESMHALSAFATTVPGQWQEGRRWMTISSRNMTDMAPLQGVVSGERVNEHLSEQLGADLPALTVLGTDRNTPFFFNFHVGAIGHTLVVGPTRVGKSIGMNFLISQFTKYPGAQVVIFDKDHSCRQPTLLQGGQYMDLRADGDAIRLNPMVLAQNREHWPFLTQWIENLISSRGYQVTAEDAKSIYEAVAGIAANPDPDVRRLLTVRTLLPGHLRIHLDEWSGNGQNAHFFDHTDDTFALSQFTAIEMGEIMKQPSAARAFMDYAFYRIDDALSQQKRGDIRVTMIYVEEAWLMLADPRFAMRVMDWLKTLAKRNAFVVLTTQSIEDLLTSDNEAVFAAIRDNIATKIFLPNANALSDSLNDLYRKKFMLSEETVQRIALATPRQDYIVVKPDVVRTVRMALTPLQVAALRSDIKAQRVFDRHWRNGDPIPDWERAYLSEMLNGPDKSAERKSA